LLSEQQSFVAAYPQGTRDELGKTFHNVGYAFHANSTVDDVGFVRHLVSLHIPGQPSTCIADQLLHTLYGSRRFNPAAFTTPGLFEPWPMPVGSLVAERNGILEMALEV
jgi:hypothetical protein